MSKLAPKIAAPAPPPEPRDYNVDDRVGGRRTTIVTGADGNKTAVIEENLTPEQKQIRDNLKKISDEALTKYEALVNDPMLNDPAYTDVRSAVDNIYTGWKQNLDSAYQDAATATEKTAARFGVEDSTTANILRSQNTANYAGAQEQLGRDKTGLINQYRQQEMQNQLGLYGVASGRQDTLFAQGMQTLGLGNQIALSNAARNDTYQQNLYNQNVNLAIARGNAQAQGMQTLGQIGGLALGGYLGGGFGATGTKVANPAAAGFGANNYNVTGLGVRRY